MKDQMSSIKKEKFYTGEDDGLLIRESGEWAVEKLDYLHRLMVIITKSMHLKPWKGINFIDLFCGPGKCHIRKTKQILLGSPLLAVNLEYPFSECFFVDSDALAIEALRTRISYLEQKLKNNFYIGDCNKLVKEITSQIAKIDRNYVPNRWSSLNLAFLDPEGLELEWNTVTELGRIKRMDLLINYPQMGLTRQMPKEIDQINPSRIDKFFGGNEWRNVYKDHQNGKIKHLHRELLDLYEDKIKELGYVEIQEYEPLMRNKEKNAPLYRLIFASKHKLGNEFWDQITQHDVHGQTRLC